MKGPMSDVYKIPLADQHWNFTHLVSSDQQEMSKYEGVLVTP